MSRIRIPIAFCGAVAVVNVHSAAFPAGVIRGQLTATKPAS